MWSTDIQATCFITRKSQGQKERSQFFHHLLPIFPIPTLWLVDTFVQSTRRCAAGLIEMLLMEQLWALKPPHVTFGGHTIEIDFLPGEYKDAHDRHTCATHKAAFTCVPIRARLMGRQSAIPVDRFSELHHQWTARHECPAAQAFK